MADHSRPASEMQGKCTPRGTRSPFNGGVRQTGFACVHCKCVPGETGKIAVIDKKTRKDQKEGGEEEFKRRKIRKRSRRKRSSGTWPIE